MSAAPLAHLSYDWRGDRERLVRIGEGGRIILFLAPLFEEANRTRHFLIETMRTLSARGFSCLLPDLPGTLESAARLSDLGWDDWTGAVAAVGNMVGPAHVASFRGGALLAPDNALSHWRLAPIDGAGLFRDLIRVRLASLREEGAARTTAELEAEAVAEPVTIAGYRFEPPFLSAMRGARIADRERVRVVRLDTDAQPADAKLAGQPLWRRSEPEHDPAFAKLVADDISDWIASCNNI